jgi:fructose-1,6-bisphosphatase/inositol monophosphatase family enzyme
MKEILTILEEVGKEALRLWPRVSKEESKRLENLTNSEVADLPTLKKFNVRHKEDGTLVSDVDLFLNDYLIKALKRVKPSMAIFSEEGPQDLRSFEKESLWLIDPLDGTSPFLKGRDDFSILLGLLEDGEVTFGAMYFPARNLMSYATKRKGAYINNERIFIEPSSLSFRKEGISFRNVTQHQVEDEDLYHYVRYPAAIDSGLAQLKVCQGTLDGFVMRITTAREWDFAAASLILEESGGVMFNERGERILFKKPGLDFKYVLASSHSRKEELLSLVRFS